MNVAREAFVPNAQHKRTDSQDRCIVRLLFTLSTQIIMLLYPAGIRTSSHTYQDHVYAYVNDLERSNEMYSGTQPRQDVKVFTMFQALTQSAVFQGVAFWLGTKTEKVDYV